MESELALHSAIVALSPVTVAPALFGTLISLHAVDSLLQLLSHENADVACAVLDLLHELTDPSLLADEEQEDADAELIDNAINSLIDALVRSPPLLLLDETSFSRTFYSYTPVESVYPNQLSASMCALLSRWRTAWWRC